LPLLCGTLCTLWFYSSSLIPGLCYLISLFFAPLFFSFFGAIIPNMTITQTVDIPANRRVTIEIPREAPTGKANVIIQFPVLNEKTVYSTLSNEVAISMTGEVIGKYRPALEDLAK